MHFSLPAKVLPSSYDLPTHRGRRAKSTSNTTSILLVLTALYFFVFTYFYFVSARDPTSFFFDKKRAYTQKYSKHRNEQADAFLTGLNDAALQVKATDHPPRMCVGLATVARRGRQYVSTTVASLLEGLSESERRSIFVNVLVAHSDPHKHPEHGTPWLKVLPDKVLTYDMESSDIDRIRAWEDGGWYRNKTIYDYTYLLKDCYDTGSEYIAMIEDDTIAAQDWYRRALSALEIIATDLQTSPQSRWAYLRLFYVEDLLGWNSEEWMTYLFWSLVVWSTCTLTMLSAKRRFRWQSDVLSYSCIGAISGLFIPISIGLFFMAGRQTVRPIQTGVKTMNKYGCCSQALVFPRTIVPMILARADLTTDWLVDMMLEVIADKEHLDRYVLVPAAFQHIGATSSKGYGFDDNARGLWNFRFEDYVP